MLCFFKLVFFVIFVGLSTAKEDGKAGWHDPNIVLDKHNIWRQMPPLPADAPKPPLPYDDKALRNDTTVIVLIASFRESRCGTTLMDMFKQATNPKRIFAGVVQQNDDNDVDCLADYCSKVGTPLVQKGDLLVNDNNCPYFSQVRMLRMHSRDAKGPVYARALQSTLVADTEFCMQIDAHTGFAKDWDVLMLREWWNCQNEYAVLSTYPTNIHDLGKNSNKHWEMPHLCAAFFVGPGQVRNARARAAANLERPILAPLWAAGLSFSRCHAEKKVPNDINLLHVFNGEEFGRGARLWTHGYDFYTVTRPYIGTYYGGEKGNQGGWRVNHEELRRSNERLSTLLKWPNSNQSEAAIAALGKYNLGTMRTLEQYANFSGIDTVNQKIDPDRCICQWVKWDDNALREEYHIRNRPKTLAKQKVIRGPGEEMVSLNKNPTSESAHSLTYLWLIPITLGFAGSWYKWTLAHKKQKV